MTRVQDLTEEINHLWDDGLAKIAMMTLGHEDVAANPPTLETIVDSVGQLVHEYTSMKSELERIHGTGAYASGDGCLNPGCMRRGTPGNENVVKGALICDDCSAVVLAAISGDTDGEDSDFASTEWGD